MRGGMHPSLYHHFFSRSSPRTQSTWIAIRASQRAVQNAYVVAHAPVFLGNLVSSIPVEECNGGRVILKAERRRHISARRGEDGPAVIAGLARAISEPSFWGPSKLARIKVLGPVDANGRRYALVLERERLWDGDAWVVITAMPIGKSRFRREARNLRPLDHGGGWLR